LLPKFVKTHVRTFTISKIFPGVVFPGPLLNREGAGRGKERVGEREGGEERRVEGWEWMEGGREGGREGGKGRELRGIYASIHQGGSETLPSVNYSMQIQVR
jgi:hypothetical protein